MGWQIHNLPPKHQAEARKQLGADGGSERVAVASPAGRQQPDTRSVRPRPATVETERCRSTRPARPSYNPKVVDAWFQQCGLPCPTYELQFAPPRKWRFDLAWKDHHLALEAQGGIFSHGRHNRGAALLKEWDKLNTAAIWGWRILYVQPDDLCTVATAELIKRALAVA